MKSEEIIRILNRIADNIDKNKDYLSELDGAIGDGDHGINMSRGFGEVRKQLDSLTDKEPSEIFKSVGITLVKSVGGASGPLYGTAFMKAAAAVRDKKELDINDFSLALNAAIEGVKMRGHSTRGEKTMLDAMIPSLDALNTSIANGSDTATCLSDAVGAAEDGVYYTKTIVASKGRASYLGVRSIGHEDPGAASYKIILETIANEYNEYKEQKEN